MGLKFWSLRVRVCSEMYTKYENNYLSLISPLKIFHQPEDNYKRGQVHW